MAKKLERLPQIRLRTGLSRSMIYLLMERKQFPASIKITERSVAWDSELVDKWIEDRIRQSHTAKDEVQS